MNASVGMCVNKCMSLQCGGGDELRIDATSPRNRRRG